MLQKAGIPFDMQRMKDGWAIYYHGHGDKVVSDAIEHRGSYGHENDLLEIMGLTRNEDTVEGYLDAETVFGIWKAHWDKEEKADEAQQGENHH